MHVCCVPVNGALEEAAFVQMMDYVTPEKSIRIRRYRKPEDAARALLGDLVIRFLLCRHYGFRNAAISYVYGEFGKPYLAEHPHIHFNISHSGDWVVGVVATALVGIDIEKRTALKTDVSALALTRQEIRQLRALPETRQGERFFELWTLKESYVKAIGTGLSEGLGTLQVSTEGGVIRMEKDGAIVPAHFDLLTCATGYTCALCSYAPIRYKENRVWLPDEFREGVKASLVS